MFGTRIIVSYQALDSGANAATLGIIAASFAAIAAFTAIPLGRVIDRIGTRPVMVVGALLCALMCALIPSVDSLAGLAVTQAFLGLGQLMAVVGSHTMLATLGDDASRAGRVGIYTSAASFGIGLGPWLAGQIVGEAYDPGRAAMAAYGGAGLAAIAAALIAIVPSSRLRRSIDRLEPSALSVRATLGRPGMVAALVSGIAALVAVDLLMAYLPAYGEEHGITPQTVGLLVAVLSFAQIGSRLVLGRLLDRFGAAQVLAASLVLAGLCVPVMLVTADVQILIAVMAITGAGLGLAQPLTLVWVVRVMPRNSQGLGMGVRMTGNRLGQLAIPLVIGATAGRFGVSAILLTVSAMLIGATAFISSRRRSFDDTLD